MIKYLGSMRVKVKILWCYFLWYFYFLIKYFDIDPNLWSCSFGISLLVGFVLNINSYDSLKDFLKLEDKWKISRFFIIPFCVSSFPAIIKGKGFILFFSPHLIENLYAGFICISFWSFTYLCKKISKFHTEKIMN